MTPGEGDCGISSQSEEPYVSKIPVFRVVETNPVETTVQKPTITQRIRRVIREIFPHR